MLRTGYTFSDYFVLATTFLPLIPVLLSLFRKNPATPALHYLIIICLLGFLRGIIAFTSALHAENQSLINNVLAALELVLLLQIFRTTLTGKLRDLLNIILIAYLSVYITWFSVHGWTSTSQGFVILQSCFILASIALSLPPLIRHTNLGIFHSPLFWIATGTLVYYFLALLLECPGPVKGPAGSDLQQEISFFLNFATLVRYLFYTEAVLLFREKPDPEKSNS